MIDYKTGREFILVLVDLVSRGGNLLLDIGPDGDGTIPPIMEQRLVEIGDWLKVNGEAIYGTRFAGRSCQWTEGKLPEQKFGEYMVKYNLMDQIGQKPTKDGGAVKQVFFTRKPDALYAITPGWPGKQLVLRDVKVPVNAAVTMLGVPGALNTRVEGNSLVNRIAGTQPRRRSVPPCVCVQDPRRGGSDATMSINAAMSVGGDRRSVERSGCILVSLVLTFLLWLFRK